MTIEWRERILVIAALLLHPATAAAQPALFEETDRVEPPDEFAVEIMTSPDVAVASLELVEESGILLHHGDVYYAAREGSSLSVIDAVDPDLPIILETIQTDGLILKMEIKSGTLVVTLEVNTVLVFSIADPRKPSLLEEIMLPPEATSPGIETTVKKVDKGFVFLGSGEEDGITKGMKFAIYSERTERPRAIITITKTSAHFSKGPLPLRGAASAGDRAFATEVTWKSTYWMLPDPEPGAFQIAVDLMPIVGMSRARDTWGFLADFELWYRFRNQIELGLVMTPGGFASCDDGRGGVFELGAMFGYSSRTFGYAIGAGAHVSGGYGKHKGMWLNRIRFGAEEGLSFLVDLYWVIPSVHSSGLMLLPSTFIMTLNVPVHPRAVIYGQAGGGNLAIGARNSQQSGWSRLLVGARTLVAGSSGPGAVMLSTGLGYGYVWDHSPFDSNPQEGGFTGGLLIHVGVDWKM